MGGVSGRGLGVKIDDLLDLLTTASAEVPRGTDLADEVRRHVTAQIAVAAIRTSGLNQGAS